MLFSSQKREVSGKYKLLRLVICPQGLPRTLDTLPTRVAWEQNGRSGSPWGRIKGGGEETERDLRRLMTPDGVGGLLLLLPLVQAYTKYKQLRGRAP